ncbi:lytic transglycosylase domain-containing protein [Methylophilus aquaticus]|uniref:Lytic transglycosylase domain-containing protein n=1 Tax=Methylophilus aquaticus TaxID=1971610 RepID=A0ABT9JUD3_9PROT|nr:lytic transglycosylase domain-containing protein [Methylophilus aquaticus]MDP8568197.1 lytic transglycosylase domain-containing protein [Methylophilus aquaticus]
MMTCTPLTLFTCLWLTGITIAHAEPVYADNPGEIIQLTEQVWMDSTDSEEVLISNHQEDASMLSDQPQLSLALKRWRLSSPPPYQPEVSAAARDTQIEPALIHAVIAVESGYNPRAVSAKGAYGLMQVLPATARGLSTVPLKQWSASQQVMLGAHYLKQLLAMFKGDMQLALAAYNAGPNAVKTHHDSIPPFAETRRYVPKVLAYYHAFKQQLAAQQAITY